ncbi:MAG: helix-turn-helix domain-containing protein [Albidovulum sp.]
MSKEVEIVPAYVRTKQAAKYTGLGVSSLHKWRLKGRPFGEGPPFVKLGKVVLYNRDELDRWLDAHRVSTE